MLHSLYVYIQSLTTAAECQLFGSVVRALDFLPSGPGSNPTKGGKIFSAYNAFYFCYNFQVIRVPKMYVFIKK